MPAISTTTARQTVKRVNKAMAVVGDHLEAADRALEEVADDLAAAHRGRIWEALGHSGWRAFVDAELDMTRTRSYQILDYAEIRAGLRDQLAVESVNTVDTFPAIDLVSALTEESGRGLKKHVPALAAALAEQVQDALADGQELDEDTVKDIVNSAAAGVRKDVQKAKKASKKAAAQAVLTETVVDVPPVVDNRTPAERERMDAMNVAEAEAFLVRDAAAHRFLADLGALRIDLKRMSERVGDDLERSDNWQAALTHEVELMAFYLDVLNAAANSSPGHGSTGDQAEKWVNSLEGS
ncbi:hypothetical protein M8Z33_07435 [Streptomyces sp. ZAF1911]|uniref:hypothetical protein n=1 Tax=Streptomyces sp. ZAF1911 TaxID=2944129 RepID=UPI00237B593E|nr:hypothetical protein [Streptomyces sp. ZAF1911]MDD9376506.1 hypothetical protein [Streptomyces sp. ZAF1911]